MCAFSLWYHERAPLMLHSPLVEIISMTHTRADNWLSECGKNTHSKASVCPPNPAYGCFFCFSPSFSLFYRRPILKCTPSLQSYRSYPPSYPHPTKHFSFLVKVPLTVPTNPLSHCSFPSVSWDSTFYFFPANIFTPPPQTLRPPLLQLTKSILMRSVR